MVRDIMRNFDYEENVLRFSQVNYDKKTDIYLRTHYASREKMTAVRDSYLMVYKCRTGEMLEYELPEEITTRYFVVDGYAYFQLRNSEDTHLHFAVVDLGAV